MRARKGICSMAIDISSKSETSEIAAALRHCCTFNCVGNDTLVPQGLAKITANRLDALETEIESKKALLKAQEQAINSLKAQLRWAKGDK